MVRYFGLVTLTNLHTGLRLLAYFRVLTVDQGFTHCDTHTTCRAHYLGVSYILTIKIRGDKLQELGLGTVRFRNYCFNVLG